MKATEIIRAEAEMKALAGRQDLVRHDSSNSSSNRKEKWCLGPGTSST